MSETPPSTTATPTDLLAELKKINERMDKLEKAQVSYIDPETKDSVQTRMERIAAIFKDRDALYDQKLKEYDEARGKAFDAKLAQLRIEGDIQDEKILRKSLGVEKDRPVMMSELVHLLRKASLEATEPAKRTPAIAEPGPEGIQKTGDTEVDKLFDGALGIKKDGAKQ